VISTKAARRDDWSAPSVTRRQMAYAAEDVRHLIRLRHALEADLEAKGRLEWRAGVRATSRAAPGRRGVRSRGVLGSEGARISSRVGAAALRELYALRDAAPAPPTCRRSGSSPTRRWSIWRAACRRRGRAGRHSAAFTRWCAGASVRPFSRRWRRPCPAGRPDAEAAALAGGAAGPPPFRARVERLRAWRRERAAEFAIEPGSCSRSRPLRARRFAVSRVWRTPAPSGLRRWRKGILLPTPRASFA